MSLLSALGEKSKLMQILIRDFIKEKSILRKFKLAFMVVSIIASFNIAMVTLQSGICFVALSSSTISLLGNSLSVVIIDQFDNLASSGLYYWIRSSYPKMAQHESFMLLNYDSRINRGSNMFVIGCLVFSVLFASNLLVQGRQFVLQAFFMFPGPVDLSMFAFCFQWLLFSCIIVRRLHKPKQ